jgi:uncharacterized protein YraI
MIRRTFLVVGCLSLLALSSAAEARTGRTLTELNLRTGPGTRYSIITAMPAGAHVSVVHCTSWCELYYAGLHGWASARYIGLANYHPSPPVVVVPPPMPPVIYWRYGRPWWDDHHRSWYDGHRWWYEDRWHSRPRSGVTFEFSF